MNDTFSNLAQQTQPKIAKANTQQKIETPKDDSSSFKFDLKPTDKSSTFHADRHDSSVLKGSLFHTNQRGSSVIKSSTSEALNEDEEEL